MTYNDALVLAEKLRGLSPAILSIELFGSVLRNGQGHDADFVVLVDDALAKQWWNQERELIRVRWPDFLYGQRWIVKKFFYFAYVITVKKRRHDRLEATANMLGIDLQKLANDKGEIPDFELFLFPIAWRDGKEVNMRVMAGITDLIGDRNTLGFLKRIAENTKKMA